MQSYKLQYIDLQAKKHSRIAQAKGLLRCMVCAGVFIAPMFIW